MSEILKICPFCGGYLPAYFVEKQDLIRRVRSLPQDFATREETHMAWDKKVQDED